MTMLKEAQTAPFFYHQKLGAAMVRATEEEILGIK
jgi:hypothetical protein